MKELFDVLPSLPFHIQNPKLMDKVSNMVTVPALNRQSGCPLNVLFLPSEKHPFTGVTG